MTWKSLPNRGETLRAVTTVADTRRDGVLPMDVDGVAETFGGELTLLGALQLRWHTRLAGRIERELANQPMDLESAVVTAWQRTAEELPGIRAIIDRHREHPTSEPMARAMAVSAAKERVLLAAMAGKGSADACDPATIGVGARIEEQARAAYAAPTAPQPEPLHRAGLADRLRAAFAVDRIKAALAV